MIGGVYMIHNKVNHKIYIGSTNNFMRRRREHFRALQLGTHHSIVLQRAYDKYGEQAFEFNIIRDAESDFAILEQHYFHLMRPEYNAQVNATWSSHAQEVQVKISKSKVGMGNPMYHKHHSPEAIAKIRESSIRRRDTPETQAALAIGRHWRKGKPFSVETRKKMSDAKPKRPVRGVHMVTCDVVGYESARAAMKDGFHASHISECCRGLSATHQGYRWEYAS